MQQPRLLTRLSRKTWIGLFSPASTAKSRFMTGHLNLRDFSAADAEALDRVAMSAFEQFKGDYSDWPAMERSVARMSQLSRSGELIVAELNGRIVGGVAYIGPGKPKAAYFDSTWPIIRMLVVDPLSRGIGLGRALTEECIRRAQRDKAPIIALHTTPIMTVALPMYLRMGFRLQSEAPPIYGVRYAVYTMALPSN
jgi:ribosomal protein S18 acetylase RimI-like enzyme